MQYLNVVDILLSQRNMVNEKKANKIIELYCESAPLDDKYLGYGLQRAIIPIIFSLNDSLDWLYIFPRDGRVYKSQVVPEFRDRVTLASNLIAKTISLIERRSANIANFIFSLYTLRCRVPHESESQRRCVIAIIGANYQALIRAQSFAKKRSAHLLCYFVDEIDNPAASSSNAVSNSNKLSIVERNDRQIVDGFSITEELSYLLHNKYGFNTLPLPLPYILSSEEVCLIGGQVHSSNQLIYIGALNFLYRSSLHSIIEELRYINADMTRFRLRLTVNRQIAERQLGPLPEWVICEPIPLRSKLLEEIAKSRCALMPSSFEPSAASMVATSFPSKFLDYLAAARDIFVLAPEYSSISRYLKDVPEIDVYNSAASLYDFVNGPGGGGAGRFRYLLEKGHSAARFGEQFLAMIGSMDGNS